MARPQTKPRNQTNPSSKIFNIAVLVAALGYFVDIYDLVLFSIVRVPSLRSLGITDAAELLNVGARLLNVQMIGMLIGGLLWGVIGDKKGRLSVLFGSIALYSLANIANGMVTTVAAYSLWRFVAGVGLAGELGAGITLVSEILPKETRGYGTMMVASIGILGAVVASLIGDYFDWRIAYYVGGGLGILLLLLRIGVFESGLFNAVKESRVARGNFLSLFSSGKRTVKYLSCVLIGVPIWYVIGLLITFSPELGAALGMPVAPSAGRAIMYCYIGLAAGDFLSGFLSQYLGTRKKVVLAFILMTAAAIATYVLSTGLSLVAFYALCVGLGFGSGYWAVFVTIASEQFGTNIRATVTTTAPNFVRGAVPLLIYLFQSWRGPLGVIQSAATVGAITIVVALIALWNLDETHGKDLDFVEGMS